MDLKTYVLGLKKEERGAYAARAKTTPGYLNLLINGHRRASPELAKRLAAESDGVVATSEIRPDIWGRRAGEAAA